MQVGQVGNADVALLGVLVASKILSQGGFIQPAFYGLIHPLAPVPHQRLTVRQRAKAYIAQLAQRRYARYRAACIIIRPFGRYESFRIKSYGCPVALLHIQRVVGRIPLDATAANLHERRADPGVGGEQPGHGVPRLLNVAGVEGGGVVTCMK